MPMGPMTGMRGLMVVYALIWIVVVGTVVVALWRGMRAQERIARHLESIERTLSQRPLT
jgi:Tfp pilus assembly protein PilX